MKYVIESKTYEKHINDEVHLYGLLHQLAFLAGKVKDERDMENLLDTAKRYGEIAEEKFAAWRIPGRYLVFGDRKDLAELKAAELTPLTAVLKEHDAKIREKQRAATAHDPAYIISGSAFRMLVGDLFDLLAQYSFLRNRVVEVKTEKRLARLQKNLSGENPSIRRMYIDYEAYGRDVALEENGTFTDQGYVRDTGDSFHEYYDGERSSIPDEYRVMTFQDDLPEEETETGGRHTGLPL